MQEKLFIPFVLKYIVQLVIKKKKNRNLTFPLILHHISFILDTLLFKVSQKKYGF